MTQETQEQERHLSEKSRKEGFRLWLTQPAVRLLISMIPEGSHRETLSTLLEETYDAGFSSGSAHTMMRVVGHVLDAKFKREDNR